MKPFDLEAAKRGDPIITREGMKARFIAYIPEAPDAQSVVALIEGEGVCLYFRTGTLWDKDESEYDLFMAPKKEKLWLVVYPADHFGSVRGYVYGDEATARKLQDNGQTISVEVDL